MGTQDDVVRTGQRQTRVWGRLTGTEHRQPWGPGLLPTPAQPKGLALPGPGAPARRRGLLIPLGSPLSLLEQVTGFLWPTHLSQLTLSSCRNAGSATGALKRKHGRPVCWKCTRFPVCCPSAAPAHELRAAPPSGWQGPALSLSPGPKHPLTPSCPHVTDDVSSLTAEQSW